MRLYLNIGNTHTQIARDDGGQPVLLEQYDTADIKVLGDIPLLEKMPVAWEAFAVSVVPLAQSILEKRYGSRLRFLTRSDFRLDFSAVDASTMGMDRIANAFAAHCFSHSAVAVIDCGTCINTMAVTADGRVLGGAIMPGRMMLRKSLAAYTAQLPLLPMRDKCPPPIGANTLDALAAGVDRGILGSVREILFSTQALLGDGCRFIVAGGDAPYFLANIPELQPGPGLLTIRGVAMAVDNQLIH
ncbi:MAG: type III pantothenate kinase [Victivallales bacterium]|nr:type III pantothenate kinase [Victivallales bacterium]